MAVTQTPAQISVKAVIASEKAKCTASCAYFMKEYCKIQHPTRGKIDFKIWGFQEDVLDQLQTNDLNIILKARQLGLSTLVAGYCLWLLLFHDDKRAVIIAINQEVSKNLVSKIRYMHTNLPSWLRGNCVEDNKLSLHFSNGSSVQASTSTPKSGRSEALSLLIIDEAAFIDSAEEIWTSAYSTLSTGGKGILLSTPNGVGNFFHQTWTGAEAGENDFHTIKLHWSLHPEHDQEWRDRQTAQLGERKAAQECFDGDTRIYTANGLVPIRDVHVGDLVLTHDGTFQRVSRLYSHVTNEVIPITSRLNNKHTSRVTSNHPFLQHVGGFTELSNVLDGQLMAQFPSKVTLPSMPDIIDLVGLFRPKYFQLIADHNTDTVYVNDRKHKAKHNRIIKIGYDFGYILGLYLAGGSGTRLRRTYSFNYETELNTWVTDLKYAISHVFGIESFSVRNQTDRSGQLSVNSEIFSWVIEQFVDGNDSRTKRLSKYAYNHMNVEFARGILNGYMLGDGMSMTCYTNTCSSVSSELMYDINFVASIAGVRGMSCDFNTNMLIGRTTIMGRDCSRVMNPSIIRFLGTRGMTVKDTSDMIGGTFETRYKNTFHQDEDYFYTTINIGPSECTPITVYNLEVETNHTYVTEHFVVHNCDCSFITSGYTVVDGEIIEWYKNTKAVPPIEKRGVGGDIWIWECPDYTRTYVVAADVARGDGADYSAFHVMDAESLVQCAEFRGKAGTTEFGHMLVNMATEYNNALLVVENNSIGWAVIQTIIDRGYQNLLYTSNSLEFMDTGTQLRKGYDLRRNDELKPGITTGTRLRPLLVSKLEEYFRERIPEVRSIRFAEELLVFVWLNGKAQAKHGYNDDLVMAMGMALWTRDTALKMRMEGMELTRNAVSNIQKYDGAYTANADLKQTYWSMPVPGGRDDMTWLIDRR